MSTQTAFRAALLNAAAPIPDGLLDGDGNQAGARYSVYRNNVAVSLTEALEASFPVLLKLIGAQNFKALAGLYLRAHPPSSPLMMHYGDQMSAFLHGSAPLQSVPYLPDVARLENALRDSYHAADSDPVSAELLAEITPDVMSQSRVRVAPSLRLIRSDWPLFDIWYFNTQDGAPKPRNIAQSVLITRAEFDPEPYALSRAEADSLAALQSGHTLADAVTAGEAQDPNFDISRLLGRLVSQNAITGFHH